MKRIAQEPHKIFFETLGNKTRWDIVHLLQVSECNVTEIARELGCEQSLISHHLKRLEHCGFVTVKPNGRERLYFLNSATISPLLKLADKHISAYCSKTCVKT